MARGTVLPLAVGLLVMSLNLRAALAGYPPLLPAARAELAVSSGVAGSVQAGAVLAMAAGSFGGAWVAARIGVERAFGGSVGVVAVGCLVRGIPTLAALVGGTVLVGLGIGLAGVCLAGVVRTHFAGRAGALSGGYVTAMMIGSAVASAVAVPLATLLGGWSLALAAWAVPALLAVALWVPLSRGAPAEVSESTRARPRWTRMARLGACYLAGTSLLFYGWMTWLPPYYQSQGWPPQRAGLLLAVWSLAQVPAALVVPALAERGRWRLWASGTLGLVAVGTLGALVLPVPPVLGPWLWVVLIGLGTGPAFPLGLAMIAWRSGNGAEGAATSGLAMGVGYTVAGLGPSAMGVLVDLAGDYRPALGVLLLAAAVQGWAIARIGDRPAARISS